MKPKRWPASGNCFALIRIAVGLGFLAHLSFAGVASAESTYESNIKAIVDENCASCHGAGGMAARLPLTSLSEIEALRDSVIEAIATGRMPLGKPDFAESQAGKDLLEWLNAAGPLR